MVPPIKNEERDDFLLKTRLQEKIIVE